MRILVVTQYFWPENFRINDLILALKDKGHDVEVLTGKPNYPHGKFYNNYSFFSKRTEIWNGIKVNRSPLIPRGNSGGLRLMLNYLSFTFFSIIRSWSIKGKFDKILVYEPSPITVGIPAVFLKRRMKAQMYFWVQDLWPQSLTAAGGIKNKTILNLVERLTKWIYNNSDKVLIQSEAFRELILTQGIANDKVCFYPNSVEEIFKVLEPKTEFLNLMPQGFKVLFAGNIGEAQDFDTILSAAKIVAEANKNIKWVILGDGRKKNYVAEKIQEFGLEEQFFLLGSYPIEQMPDFYACADCLLVSLKKDYIFSLTIPSKIQSYLACGKPVLASLDGEGGRIVVESQSGIAVEAQQPSLLAAGVIGLYDKSEAELKQMGLNGRKYFDLNFERDLLVNRLEQIFEGYE